MMTVMMKKMVVGLNIIKKLTTIAHNNAIAQERKNAIVISLIIL